MDKKNALKEWREKHFKELEINLTVAKTIRDNGDATSKDRNEAIKTISRLLGALQPERTSQKNVTAKKVELPKEVLEDIDSKIEALVG